MSDDRRTRPDAQDVRNFWILMALLVLVGLVLLASAPLPRDALPPVVAEAPNLLPPPLGTIPDRSDLRPSVDVPAIQEPSHEEAQPAPSTDAGREAELPAVEVPAVTAGDDDRHARRRPYHIRHGRAYHRASSGSCEPVCDFFKATARAAGLIQ